VEREHRAWLVLIPSDPPPRSGASSWVEQGPARPSTPTLGSVPAYFWQSRKVWKGLSTTRFFAPQVRRPNRLPVTLRRLFPHKSAGFGYHFWNADVLRYQTCWTWPRPSIDCREHPDHPLLVPTRAQAWEYGMKPRLGRQGDPRPSAAQEPRAIAGAARSATPLGNVGHQRSGSALRCATNWPR